MNEEKRFAYGDDTVDDCPCPAVAAGYSPNSADESTVSAEWYDEMVERLYPEEDEGIISEEKAKEAWNKAINEMEIREDPAVETAKEIKNKLNW